MKIINILAFSVFLLLTSCQGNKKSNANAETGTVTHVATSTTNKVELIDFYGTHRCVTCEAIEANAKYTVEHYFPKEMENGTVEFKTVYVDDEANYDMAEIYEATGTALFLNVIKDGKETHIDLTDFAFSKGRDQEEFSSELKLKISEQLNNL